MKSVYTPFHLFHSDCCDIFCCISIVCLTKVITEYLIISEYNIAIFVRKNEESRPWSCLTVWPKTTVFETITKDFTAMVVLHLRRPTVCGSLQMWLWDVTRRSYGSIKLGNLNLKDIAKSKTRPGQPISTWARRKISSWFACQENHVALDCHSRPRGLFLGKSVSKERNWGCFQMKEERETEDGVRNGGISKDQC